MSKTWYNIRLRLMKLLNVFLMLVAFCGCWYGYYINNVSLDIETGRWLFPLMFFVLYVVFARVYDAFLVSIHRIREMIYSQVLAVLLADSITFVVIWLLTQRFPVMWPALCALAVQLMVAFFWPLVAHRWYYATFSAQKTAIICDTDSKIESLIEIYDLNKKFDVRLLLTLKECIQDPSLLDGMETVFLHTPNSFDRNKLLPYCIERDMSVYVLPCIGDIIMHGADPSPMFHLPMMRVGRSHPIPEYAIAKRLFDIVSGAAVLVALSPVMLITALAIKLQDGGPVFYKQCRLTVGGKEFHVLKFRSMRVDAEKDGVARLSTGDNDDRITPVGRIIRKCRIDELPQLFNILGGSMSVVGPRPERPEIAAQYMEELPEFGLRLQVKAGLTGYAQVYGKYNTTPHDKLMMDLTYINKASIFEDLRIIFATIKILFTAESTDGIAEGQTTAMNSLTEEKELLFV